MVQDITQASDTVKVIVERMPTPMVRFTFVDAFVLIIIIMFITYIIRRRGLWKRKNTLQSAYRYS